MPRRFRHGNRTMLRKTLRRLLALDDPPERTALAFSIGVFIAFSPFLGLHTVLATVAAFWFRLNKVAIFAGIWINNPLLTMVPIIVVSYELGALLLGHSAPVPAAGLELVRHPRILSNSYWRLLMTEGRDLLLPYALGGTVLSVVCSAASYPVTLKILRWRRAARGKPNQA